MNELQLEEFRILEKKKRPESLLYVVEKVDGPTRCPHCMAGPEHLTRHGKRERCVRDIHRDGQPVDLLILHGRYRCKACGKTFYETIECTDERAKITKRFKDTITLACFRKPFLQAARDFDVSHTTVMRIFDDSLHELDLQRKIYTPQILTVNRLFINRELLTVFCDPDLNLLLDVNRDIGDPRNTSLLDIMEPAHRETIFADPVYIQSRVLKKRLPEAKLVLDRIHMEKFIDRVFAGQARKILRKRKGPGAGFIRTLMDRFAAGLPHTPSEPVHARFQKREAELLDLYDLLMDLKNIYLCETRAEAVDYYGKWKNAAATCRDTLCGGLLYMLEHMETEFLQYFDHGQHHEALKDISRLLELLEAQSYLTSFEATRGRILFGNSTILNEEEEVRYVPLKTPGKPRCSILVRRKLLGVHIPSLIEEIEKGHF